MAASVSEREAASKKRIENLAPLPGPRLRVLDSTGAFDPRVTSQECPRAGWGLESETRAAVVVGQSPSSFFPSCGSGDAAPAAALRLQPQLRRYFLIFGDVVASLSLSLSLSRSLSIAAAALSAAALPDATTGDCSGVMKNDEFKKESSFCSRVFFLFFCF